MLVTEKCSRTVEKCWTKWLWYFWFALNWITQHRCPISFELVRNFYYNNKTKIVMCWGGEEKSFFMQHRVMLRSVQLKHKVSLDSRSIVDTNFSFFGKSKQIFASWFETWKVIFFIAKSSRTKGGRSRWNFNSIRSQVSCFCCLWKHRRTPSRWNMTWAIAMSEKCVRSMCSRLWWYEKGCVMISKSSWIQCETSLGVWERTTFL